MLHKTTTTANGGLRSSDCARSSSFSRGGVTRLAMEGSKSSLALFPKGAAISSLDSHSPSLTQPHLPNPLHGSLPPPPPPRHPLPTPLHGSLPIPQPSRSSSCTYPDLVYCTIAMAHDSSRRFHRVHRMRFVFTSLMI